MGVRMSEVGERNAGAHTIDVPTAEKKLFALPQPPVAVIYIVLSTFTHVEVKHEVGSEGKPAEENAEQADVGPPE
jgi:hypothetical protein